MLDKKMLIDLFSSIYIFSDIFFFIFIKIIFDNV